MPEDSKKNQDKKIRNDPKEQRRPRHARNQAGKGEKKVEEVKSAPKVTVPQKPPVYEDPGPEFYKNLKRETEEILKITEEENAKYRKKEIQSNWSKYEMPIESYEEVEEHDVGADYEKLIQAPMSIGGHFQFKHEKSWDVNTGPSLYDKYFDINMDNLSLAVSTITFYERNAVDSTLFSDTDMLTMNNRATRYKQKYFHDKSYATPETEAQDKILNSLREGLTQNDHQEKVETYSEEKEKLECKEQRSVVDKNYISLDFKINAKTENDLTSLASDKQVIENVNRVEIKEQNLNLVDDIDDDLLLGNVPEKCPIKQEIKIDKVSVPEKTKLLETKDAAEINPLGMDQQKTEEVPQKIANTDIKSEPQVAKDNPVDTKNPVIESPEDLEKWLDDFLDG